MMRAAILDKGNICVGTIPDPSPKTGQVLVRTLRCALCASDAHFMCSGNEIVARSKEFGGGYADVELDRPIVMGHEFVGEIVDYGVGSRRPLAVGTRVTSIPVMLQQRKRLGIIGYVNELPGGLGEYMLLDEDLLMEVPPDMPDDHAALIEPMAVGLEHARAGEPKSGDIALVIGCGAIGLGVIAGLKLAGIGPIIATDFNAERRQIAVAMGADASIDPREMSPYEPVADRGFGQPNLIYECVGKAGLLDQMIRGVSRGARIVMGGYSLDPEMLYVPLAQDKRLKIYFACGEEQQDMDRAMRAIADGSIDVRPWIGAQIGLSGVEHALNSMSDPSSPVRTVVDPRQL